MRYVWSATAQKNAALEWKEDRVEKLAVSLLLSSEGYRFLDLLPQDHFHHDHASFLMGMKHSRDGFRAHLSDFFRGLVGLDNKDPPLSEQDPAVASIDFHGCVLVQYGTRPKTDHITYQPFMDQMLLLSQQLRTHLNAFTSRVHIEEGRSQLQLDAVGNTQTMEHFGYPDGR